MDGNKKILPMDAVNHTDSQSGTCEDSACPGAVGGTGDNNTTFSKDECKTIDSDDDNIRAVKSVTEIQQLTPTTLSSTKVVDNVKVYVRHIDNTSKGEKMQSSVVEGVEERKESRVLINKRLVQEKLESVVAEHPLRETVENAENANLQQIFDEMETYILICSIFSRYLERLSWLPRHGESRAPHSGALPSFQEDASDHSGDETSAPNINDALYIDLLCEPSVLNLAETTPITEESTTLTEDAPGPMSHDIVSEMSGRDPLQPQVQSSFAYQTADLETVPDYTQQPESNTLSPNMAEDESDAKADQSLIPPQNFEDDHQDMM